MGWLTILPNIHMTPILIVAKEKIVSQQLVSILETGVISEAGTRKTIETVSQTSNTK